MEQKDIIIIGAGAAGLMAAYLLAKAGKKVAVLEARDIIGGRIHSRYDFAGQSMVERGAEFVHGDLPITINLFKRSGIPYHKTYGEFWQAMNGTLKQEEHFIEHWDLFMKELSTLQQDMSIADFLQAYFSGPQYSSLRDSVTGFAEGYDTADTSRASAFALRDEWQDEDFEVQYKIDNGYSALINYLADEITQVGGEIHTRAAAKEIQWQAGKVLVNATGGDSYTASKLIITASVNALQLEPTEPDAITFIPEIIEQRAAIQKLGMGAIIKILLSFSEPIWQDKAVQALANNDMKKASFFFSHQLVPTWWTQYPRESTLLTGWLGGPAAADMNGKSDDEILAVAISSLSYIFGLNADYIHERLLASQIVNWTTMPYIRGSYSYATVDTKQARVVLTTPVEGTVYFAGEALDDGPVMGTVESALASGKSVAEKILEER